MTSEKMQGEIIIVKKLIGTFIAEKILFNRNGFPYSDTTSFLDNGIIDSMNVLQLVMFVEEQFGISVDDSDVVPANFDSIDRLAQYVDRKMNENGTLKD